MWNHNPIKGLNQLKTDKIFLEILFWWPHYRQKHHIKYGSQTAIWNPEKLPQPEQVAWLVAHVDGDLGSSFT
jgi:hypothetical protein